MELELVCRFSWADLRDYLYDYSDSRQVIRKIEEQGKVHEAMQHIVSMAECYEYPTLWNVQQYIENNLENDLKNDEEE